MTDDQPLVSIITPSFNQAPFLEATIQSVLGQTYPKVEYILIDGGSTDGSLDIIQRYADRLAYWESTPDRGQTDAINKGFNRATGEIMAYLNSDDLYYPQAVEEAVAFFQQHPETALVYGDADYVDAEGKVIGRFPAAQTDYRRLRNGYVHIPQQATFFRKVMWEMVGPLDPTFYFAMDYDLWVRIASLSNPVYHPRKWAAFRLHGDAKTSAAAAQCWPEMIRVHRRLGGGVVSPIYAKYALRRVIEPLMPLRMQLRLWWQRQKASSRLAERDVP